MKTAAGYNPMRWKCDIDGCYNKKKRPKIEMFSDCFPGRISLGDVDGLVEMNSNYLLLEWKPDAVTLSIGQRLVYERLPKQFSALLVAGDPETMEVTHMAWARNGTINPWSRANLFDVQFSMFCWARHHCSSSHTFSPTELVKAMFKRAA